MAGFDMDAVMKILNSNVGQSIIPAIGAGLSAGGARQSEGADRAELAKQNAIATLLTMNRDRNSQTNARDILRQNGAASVLSANPLGDEESFAARRAYIRGALPGVGQYTSSDPGAHVAKGPRMDTADIMKFLSDEGSMNAITARRKNTLNLDPNAQFSDLSAMGFGGGGSPQTPTLPSFPTRPTTGVSTGMPVNPNTGVAGDHAVGEATPGLASATSSLDAYRQSKLGERATADAAATSGDAATQKMIMDLLGKSTGSPTAQTPPPSGYEYDQKTGQLKKKGGGILSKIGSILKVAAPIAAGFIPGLGPIAAPAMAALVGGGGSALGTAMQGGGVKNSLLTGAMGAASGYGANKTLHPVSSVRTPDFNPALQRRAPINFMNNERLVGT